MHESNSSLTLHNNRARRLSTSSRRCFESASHHSSVATSNAPVHPLDPPYLSWSRHHGHRRRSRVSSTLSATVSQPNTHCSAPGIVGRALHHGSSKFLLRPPSFTSFRGSFRGPFAMAPPVDGPAIELASIDGIQHHALSAQHTHTHNSALLVPPLMPVTVLEFTAPLALMPFPSSCQTTPAAIAATTHSPKFVFGHPADMSSSHSILQRSVTSMTKLNSGITLLSGSQTSGLAMS